jgi:hypothetical protein
MSVRFGILRISTKRKEGDNMSANVYNVQTLLVGKEYRSKTLTGKIVSAEPHPKAVWYEGCESYLVEIQPDNRILTTYRTVAVKNSN